MEAMLEKKAGFKNSKIGWIPEDWSIEEIGSFSKIQTGNKDTQDKKDDGNYPFFVRSQTVERIDSYTFEGEAVLTAGDGAGVGKIYHYLNEKFDYHQRVYNIHSFSETVNGKFFFYYFSSNFQRRVFRLSAKNSVDSVRLDMISKMLIPIPSNEEQYKIAQILSTWDQALSDTQSLIIQLKKQKKGLMQKVFKGDFRFKKADGSSFQDWKKEKLSYYLKVSKVKNVELEYNIHNVLSVSGEFGIVNQIEFQGRSFAGASVANYGIVEKGDIVYTKSPLKSNPYGIIKVNKGPTGIVSTLYATYKCKPTVNGEFVDYYFQLDDNTNRYLRPLVQKGSKNDMKINNEKVLIDPVLFPSLEEQKVLVNFFKSVDEEINTQQLKLDALEQQKKGLIQQLLTGQKRVKV